MHAPVICSVDVGHGGVKYLRARTREAIICDVFEAIAPAAPLREATMGQARDTVRVTLANQGRAKIFEVGHDAHRVLGNAALRFGRVLSPQDYPLSDQYMALTRAAMYYLDCPIDRDTRRKVIDLLVLGLPMSTYRKLRDALAARMVGEHDVERGGTTYTIEVRDVKVVGQPIGGLIDWATQREAAGREIPLGHKVLLIDPGMGTVDAIVAEMTAEGFADVSGRVAAVEGGASMIYEELRKAVELETGYDVPLIEIQEALLRGEPLYQRGETYDLARYADRVGERLEEVANTIQHKVGSLRDIHQVVLVGGPASMYLEAFRSLAHKVPVEVVEEPRFANVRGFQLIGEREMLIETA